MASTTRHVLSAVVLLSVLAAASASAGTSCVPGLAIPHNPLERYCRQYVAIRACGVKPVDVREMPVMKERCCRELSDIAAYCRCEALRILMDGVVAPGGGQREGRLHDLPGCPRQTQRVFAATLATEPECNLMTIFGGPYCVFPSTGEDGGEQTHFPPSSK